MQKLLRTVGNPTIVVTWGIGRLMLRSLIDEAIFYMRDEFDVQLKARRLPKELRQGGTRDQLWHALEETVSPSCVAILSLEGQHSHWTVASHVTTTSIRLFDSGRMQALRRGRCTVRKTNRAASDRADARGAYCATSLIPVRAHDLFRWVWVCQ